MIKKYFNSVKNSRATVFRASASCSKILNVKNIFNTVKNCRATLFFRASASCSKILNVKSIFDTVKIFRAHSVFQGKRKLLKTPECKKYIFNAVNSGQLCFSGQAQSCSKILNGEKYIQYSEKFQGKLYFQGKRKEKFFQDSEKFQSNSVFSGKAQVTQNRER